MLSTTDFRAAVCVAILACASRADAQSAKPGRVAIGMLQGIQSNDRLAAFALIGLDWYLR